MKLEGSGIAIGLTVRLLPSGSANPHPTRLPRPTPARSPQNTRTNDGLNVSTPRKLGCAVTTTWSACANGTASPVAVDKSTRKTTYRLNTFLPHFNPVILRRTNHLGVGRLFVIGVQLETSG